ncbi:RDD family protein [Microbulbifer sp. ARAS458-1]|uniref:RDD family protein n=1 Tax=Microbulbifer sp. ARAS458-1 TaxID=3140242 RepID=UPI003877C545
MNPWAHLGIEPCDDPRAVKRAYAAKLKLNRPDEKPEEFQQLLSAYKMALKLAQAQARRSAPVAEELTEVLIEEPAGAATESVVEPAREAVPPLIESSPQVSPVEQSAPLEPEEAGVEIGSEAEEDAARQLRIEEYRRVLVLVEQVLEDPLRIHREERWHFLAESRYMLEEEYNWNLGLAVFERFARFNQDAAKHGGKHNTHITGNVLAYCDQLFGWSGNAPAYYQQFDEALADTLFDAMQPIDTERDPTTAIRGGSKLVREKPKVAEEQLGQYFFGSLLGRSVAVLLDMMLVHLMMGVMATAIIMKVSGRAESDATVLGIVVTGGLYLVGSWLCECSRWQTTPGKWVMGYKVTNKNFQRLGYGRGLWRTLSFTLTLVTYKIGWFINCFLGGNLMHDRLSGTHVINYRKSREEHLRRQK